MKLQKENIPFTMVANELLCDNRISWKAKGLYAYLFSKPDGWDFAGDRIVREGLDKRHAVFAGLKELEEHGYLRRQRMSNGRVEYQLMFSDGPIAGNQQMAIFEPLAENHKVRKPSMTEISTVTNKEGEKEGGENKKDTAVAVGPFSLKEEVEKMYENTRRDINIVALYFENRWPDIRSREQLNVAIRRHLPAAKSLVPFTDDQILDAIPRAKRITEGWTIETLGKILTK